MEDGSLSSKENSKKTNTKTILPITEVQHEELNKTYKENDIIKNADKSLCFNTT